MFNVELYKRFILTKDLRSFIDNHKFTGLQISDYRIVGLDNIEFEKNENPLTSQQLNYMLWNGETLNKKPITPINDQRVKKPESNHHNFIIDENTNINCKHIKNCKQCFATEYAENCIDVGESSFCKDCNTCINNLFTKNCTNSSDCIASTGCIDSDNLENCHNCNSSSACTDSVKLYDCTSCETCVNLIHMGDQMNIEITSDVDKYRYMDLDEINKDVSDGKDDGYYDVDDVMDKVFNKLDKEGSLIGDIRTEDICPVGDNQYINIDKDFKNMETEINTEDSGHIIGYFKDRSKLIEGKNYIKTYTNMSGNNIEHVKDIKEDAYGEYLRKSKILGIFLKEER